MSKRRSNSSLTVEQWLMITGGVAALGVGAYFIFRKPATSTTTSTTGANAPLPGGSTITDDSAFLNTPATQAAIAATQPAPFSLGIDPATTYNRHGAALGDPNDINSAAAACILAHQYANSTDPGVQAEANRLASKCIAGGGTPNW